MRLKLLILAAVLATIQTAAASTAISLCTEIKAPENYYLVKNLSGLYGDADHCVDILASDKSGFEKLLKPKLSEKEIPVGMEK